MINLIYLASIHLVLGFTFAMVVESGKNILVKVSVIAALMLIFILTWLEAKRSLNETICDNRRN